jgi:hypothetical protein
MADRLAARSPRRRLDDRDRLRAGGGDHRPPGVARNDESLQLSTPLVAVGLRRWRRPEAVRVRVLLAVAASYASLFLLLLWQALRGRSVVAPDASALASIAIWAVVTVSVCLLLVQRVQGIDPRRMTSG